MKYDLINTLFQFEVNSQKIYLLNLLKKYVFFFTVVIFVPFYILKFRYTNKNAANSFFYDKIRI